MAISMCFMLVYGCGGKKLETTPIQKLKAPEWVVKGSGAFTTDRDKVFHAVGSAFGINNPALLRTMAENRARNEIAKVFQFYTASLMKDYMASTTAGVPDVSSEEHHIEQAIKTVTAMTLSGVIVVDYWQNPQTGEFFSLAELDLKTFGGNVGKLKELDPKIRDYIRENAERLHEELEREAELQNRR
jgi:hypothetical protein